MPTSSSHGIPWQPSWFHINIFKVVPSNSHSSRREKNWGRTCATAISQIIKVLRMQLFWGKLSALEDLQCTRLFRKQETASKNKSYRFSAWLIPDGYWRALHSNPPELDWSLNGLKWKVLSKRRKVRMFLFHGDCGTKIMEQGFFAHLIN